MTRASKNNRTKQGIIKYLLLTCLICDIYGVLWSAMEAACEAM
jgi:hypothetical protein